MNHNNKLSTVKNVNLCLTVECPTLIVSEDRTEQSRVELIKVEQCRTEHIREEHNRAEQNITEQT